MTLKTTLTAAILAMFVTGAAHAQMTMPMPGTAPLSSVDQKFLIKDAGGSVGDLGHGEAAVQRASTVELEEYALQIVEDHTRLNMKLFQLAHKKGVSLPVVMEDKDRAELVTLVKRSGTDFDRAFLQDEVRINTEDVKDADTELAVTTDPDVRSLVQEYRNTEAIMLQRAQGFLNQMGGK